MSRCIPRTSTLKDVKDRPSHSGKKKKPILINDPPMAESTRLDPPISQIVTQKRQNSIDIRPNFESTRTDENNQQLIRDDDYPVNYDKKNYNLLAKMDERQQEQNKLLAKMDERLKEQNKLLDERLKEQNNLLDERLKEQNNLLANMNDQQEIIVNALNKLNENFNNMFRSERQPIE
jgi:hypothetical protein